ncbi:hypothetical protein DSM112329_02034 [Paraconexibacter sp. AEG42_29]|uniref:Phosphatidylinositol diacylglycerol-lyase n=1 Tax=Paraconexibacter sp. AEG42_29 TaxID=2997339 RepID=A0AAU7AU15_9ACTN
MGTCSRARALLTVTAVMLTTAAATAPTGRAQAPVPAPSPTAACAQLAPIALPCTLLGKATEALSAACRRAGVPDAQCTLPLAKRVTRAEKDAYLTSAVHRNAQFQSRLGDALPLLQAPWLGTHNSFNSVSEEFTASRSDSNQQLSLTDQLDIDIRSLEIDLHYLARSGAPGGREVVVCHGQGPSALDAGCTSEPPFTAVLPEVANWLNAPGHADEVLLLYLEDDMENDAAYPLAVATLDAVLRRPDGRSLIYRPAAGTRAANGCSPLPLTLTRAQVRASGARVVLVGKCAKGWASNVHDWNPVHVESGRTAAYRPYPACDGTYARSVYATKLVRYYEDSTLVATVIDPATPSVDPEALTPAKVAAMTACGVGLFGFDQLLPQDGRIAASIWSWAAGQPKATATCTVQGTDARWRTSRCTVARRAACIRSGTRWTLTAKAVPFSRARKACRSRGARFAVPRSGLQNQQLHAAAGGPHAVWIAHRTR